MIALVALAALTIPAGQESKVEFIVSPILDLHFGVRRLAAEEPGLAVVSGDHRALLKSALAKCWAVGDALGAPRFWALIEGNMSGLHTAGQLKQKLATLPESVQLRDETITVREPTLQYVAALAALEPPFLEESWPERSAALNAARDSLLQNGFGPEQRLISEIQSRLGITDPGIAIPVNLVTDAPTPGAFTDRSVDDAVCFVAIRERSNPLPEIVLHEALHALDAATAEQNHALNDLRKRLDAADVNGQLIRDVAHTLFFVTAAETVQDLVDPDAKHYGDASGYYKRVGSWGERVRDIWTAHLDGDLSRDAALDQICEVVAPPRWCPGWDSNPHGH